MFDYTQDPNFQALPALSRHTIAIVHTVMGGDEDTVKAAIAALSKRFDQQKQVASVHS